MTGTGLKSTEGPEKAIAATISNIVLLFNYFQVSNINPASIEAMSMAIAAIATPVLVWLTANTKR